MDPIGKELLKVPISHLSLSHPICFDEKTPLVTILKGLQEESVENVAIEKQGRVTGVLTAGDFLLKVDFQSDWGALPASHIMTPYPLCLSPSAQVGECLRPVALKKIFNLPVCDGQGKIRSMVSVTDLLQFLIHPLSQNLKTGSTTQESGPLLEGLIPRGPFKLDEKTPFKMAIEIMQKERQTCILTMQYETLLKGILTEKQALLPIRESWPPKATLAGAALPARPLLFKHTLAHAINTTSLPRDLPLVIVDEEAFPLGVLGPFDLLTSLIDTFGLLGGPHQR